MLGVGLSPTIGGIGSITVTGLSLMLGDGAITNDSTLIS